MIAAINGKSNFGGIGDLPEPTPAELTNPRAWLERVWRSISIHSPEEIPEVLAKVSVGLASKGFEKGPYDYGRIDVRSHLQSMAYWLSQPFAPALSREPLASEEERRRAAEECQQRQDFLDGAVTDAVTAADDYSNTEEERQRREGLLASFGLGAKPVQPDYLVSGLLRTAQLVAIGGPKKTLKTTFGAFRLAISLASGVPFLGWTVPKQRRVLLLSGETDLYDLEQCGERICRALGIPGGLRSLLGQTLFIGDRLPLLSSRVGVEALSRPGRDGLRQIILDAKAEVVMLDPLKDCLSAAAASRTRGGVVGGQTVYLNQYRQLCNEAGATPMMVHHATKHFPLGVVMDLDDFSDAGMGETAGQWLLLSRRTAYDPNNRLGCHELLLNYGRRGGGESGILAVDVDEGLTPGSEWRESAYPWQPDAEHGAKAVRKRPGPKVKDRTDEILAVISSGTVQATPDGRFLARKIRDELHVSGASWKAILGELEASGRVLVEREERKQGKRSYTTVYLRPLGHGTS